MLPAGLDQVYFSSSGAESVEATLKLARRHTKQKYFISFYGGFHGRTYRALSLTATKAIQRKHFGLESASCVVDVIRYLREEIFRTEVSPEEVAAIIVEPIQGEGGYVVPPARFLRALRDLCDEYGFLLVVDEVQAGCYRTGRFLASEHEGVVPDIMQAPGFGEHVRETGAVLLDGLRRLQERHEIVGDVRGVGIELVENRVNRMPARAFERGLTLLPSARHGRRRDQGRTSGPGRGDGRSLRS